MLAPYFLKLATTVFRETGLHAEHTMALGFLSEGGVGDGGKNHLVLRWRGFIDSIRKKTKLSLNELNIILIYISQSIFFSVQEYIS